MASPKITPKELLKTRRPEHFSDSVVEEISELDTRMLEYHLDTLTNREQSREFENFARKLAQKTICPNLLPQTGPTGGGDSKVDSETFPVAESLAFAWSIGEPKNASEERWAFAFSAKKVWQPKLKSDIKKLAATNRDYKKAFFVTNQYVPDRARAKLEDELRQKHSIDVRILDRSWIVSQIFEKGHIDVAIEELDASPSLRRESKVGPRDYQRSLLLTELETRIRSACEAGAQSFGFVDDCLEAAKLIAGLERDRTQVEGALERARRAAREFGTDRQKLLVAYQHAWIAFWWYEDYIVFNEQYEVVQSLAVGSRYVYDLESLHTLWNLKYTSVVRGAFSDEADKMKSQTECLENELQRLSNDEERPSTAYHADGLRVMMQILQNVKRDPGPAISEMKEIIETCAGLVGFPFDSFAAVLLEIGKWLASSDGYADLFECLVSAFKQRRGEVASATLLLNRANQLLDANEPVEAIRVIGRSLIDLYKHESRKELIHALYLAAAGYRQIGLLYAARGSMLAAASIATSHFWDHQEPIPPQAACYNRIKWLECELGRIPQAMDWHRSEIAVRAALDDAGYEGPDRTQEQMRFDAVLSQHFLRTDLWQLRRLTKLPATLENYGLFISELALRYALGDVDGVRKELSENLGEDTHPDEFYASLRDQARDLELPSQPIYGDGQKVVLQTSVLGCEVNIEATNNLYCLTLAESVLAALEAILATGLVDKVVAQEPRAELTIQPSEFTDRAFDFKFDDTSLDPRFVIRCNIDKVANTDTDVQNEIQEQMFELIANVLAHVFPPQDGEQTLERWFRDDKALHRSINFTSSFVTIRNILGDSPATDISCWINEESPEIPLTRSVAWDADDGGRKAAAASGNSGTPEPGVGEPPESMRTQMGRVNHRKLRTISIIRENLWNRADWQGTMFVAGPTMEYPPFLAFVFRNAQAAKQIFADWKRTIGSVDTSDKISVSIITGIEKSNPFAYRVIVGPGDFRPTGKEGYAFLKSRVHTMTPSNHENLNRFVRCFEQAKLFGLTFAIDEQDGEMPMPDFSAAIQKDQFSVVEAWRLGRNDPRVTAIQPDDDIIIPSDQPNVPIIEALAMLNQLRKVHTPHSQQESVADLRKRRRNLQRKMKDRDKL